MPVEPGAGRSPHTVRAAIRNDIADQVALGIFGEARETVEIREICYGCALPRPDMIRRRPRPSRCMKITGDAVGRIIRMVAIAWTSSRS